MATTALPRIFVAPFAGVVVDRVDRRRLLVGMDIMRGTAVALIATGSGMLGNRAGGFLFQLLGATLMFLFNGISYLVSSFTLAFIRLPPLPRTGIKQHLLVDLKEGLRFAWRVKGLRTILITAGFLNFFGIAGFTLILPLFQRTAGLGPGVLG